MGHEDGLTKELVEKYITRRVNDVAYCLEALDANNFLEISRIGHQLKGNGVSFGFGEISSIGANLEFAANTRNNLVVKEEIQRLKKVLIQHLLRSS